MTLLEARSISYAYIPQQAVLSDVSLAVPDRAVIYLLGHNGCGKTTLLVILSGIRPPQAGTVRLNGPTSTTSPRPGAQRVGLVPQMHLPVFACRPRRDDGPHATACSARQARDRAIVDAAVSRSGWRRCRATRAGGGERQLTLIARGWPSRPKSCCSTSRPHTRATSTAGDGQPSRRAERVVRDLSHNPTAPCSMRITSSS